MLNPTAWSFKGHKRVIPQTKKKSHPHPSPLPLLPLIHSSSFSLYFSLPFLFLQPDAGLGLVHLTLKYRLNPSQSLVQGSPRTTAFIIETPGCQVTLHTCQGGLKGTARLLSSVAVHDSSLHCRAGPFTIVFSSMSTWFISVCDSPPPYSETRSPQHPVYTTGYSRLYSILSGSSYQHINYHTMIYIRTNTYSYSYLILIQKLD